MTATMNYLPLTLRIIIDIATVTSFVMVALPKTRIFFGSSLL